MTFFNLSVTHCTTVTYDVFFLHFHYHLQSNGKFQMSLNASRLDEVVSLLPNRLRIFLALPGSNMSITPMGKPASDKRTFCPGNDKYHTWTAKFNAIESQTHSQDYKWRLEMDITARESQLIKFLFLKFPLKTEVAKMWHVKIVWKLVPWQKQSFVVLLFFLHFTRDRMLKN